MKDYILMLVCLVGVILFALSCYSFGYNNRNKVEYARGYNAASKDGPAVFYLADGTRLEVSDGMQWAVYN